jgi:hypothetical protein
MRSRMRGPMLAALTTLAALAAAGTAHAQDVGYARQSSPGRVTLDVQPVWRDAGLVVEIAANTHSVDLSGIDLAKAVRLRVDGKEVDATSATTLRGHHARGSVTFALAEAPQAFQITIRGVPDQPERVLRWPAGN